LVYFGRHLRTVTGATEPALIDPELPVDVAAPERSLPDPGGGPSYHLLPPAARAGYLRWLAGARRGTGPVWFARLFLFGLERRVLIDADHDPSVRRDLPAIAAEVRRLRARYVGDEAFSATADALLDVVELVGAARVRPGGAVAFAAPPQPPALGSRGDQRGRAPMALRIALARSAVTGTPVPVEWAKGWLWHHPGLPSRMPQRRCSQEFDRLFTLRYALRYGAGLVPQPAGDPIRLTYHPASPGLSKTVIERPDLPDVLTGSRNVAAMLGLLDEVAEALTPYSRWLARHPDGHASLAATALLPDELIDVSSGPLGHLVRWARAHLDGRRSAVIDATELGVFWSSADPARMSGEEASGLSVVLARVGLGIEPDIRFSGPSLAAGPAVLFRLPDGAEATAAAPGRADPALQVVVGAVDLAAGLVAARNGDGLADNELQTMIDEIVAETGTVPAPRASADAPRMEDEAARLGARLLWRVAVSAASGAVAVGTAAGRAGRDPAPGHVVVPGRVAATMSAAQRAATGRFLVTVATHITGVTPSVVAALVEAYRALGLDTDRIHARIVATAAGSRAGHRISGEPVVVRHSDGDEPGYALPWTTAGAARPDREIHSGGQIHLDEEVLARKRTETDEVSALLTMIFAAEDDPGPLVTPPDTQAPPSMGTPSNMDSSPVAGLDSAHCALLTELAERPFWTRAEFVALAARHSVLPDGAVDLLNEMALEVTGETVVDGDDDLYVNDAVLQELLP
jgi:hypothetical protein